MAKKLLEAIGIKVPLKDACERAVDAVNDRMEKKRRASQIEEINLRAVESTERTKEAGDRS